MNRGASSSPPSSLGEPPPRAVLRLLVHFRDELQLSGSVDVEGLQAAACIEREGRGGV